MLTIPFTLKGRHHGRGPHILVLILERENLDRMKQADPFDIHLRTLHPHLDTEAPIRSLDIVIAYEEDTEKLLDFHQRGDIGALMEWLERGRKIEPGDVTPAVSLTRGKVS